MNDQSTHGYEGLIVHAKRGWPHAPTDIKNCILLLMAREWDRLLIEPSRLAAMLAQPFLFLVLFGAGFHESFVHPQAGLSYIDFLFPGVLGLVVLFSSIYSTLTLVDDKREGFFRLMVIGPAGATGAVIGKVLGTAAISFLQSLLFLLMISFIKPGSSLSSVLFAIGLLALGALCFSLIGVLFAWLCPSSSAFHAVMSIVLLPMWLLSGAMFPIDSGFLKFLGFLNPMAFLVNGLRKNLFQLSGHGWSDLLCLCSFVLLAAILLSDAVTRRPIE